MKTNELWADSIIKSFGNKTILNDVFLKLESGKILALIGRNGSGKSTLLKILFGTLDSEQKYVRLNEKILTGLSGIRGLGYLPQHNFLPAGMTIKTAFKIYGCSKYPEWISPLINKKPKELSGGELRICETLLFLNSEHRIILLDEPFTGLSPIQKEQMATEIESAKKEKAILITDHDYRTIIPLADEIVLLNDGATKIIENKDELVTMGYLKSTP